MARDTRSKVLEYIKLFMAKHGWNSPRHIDFVKDKICTSTSVVNYHLVKLEREGKIKRDGRMIELPEAKWTPS